MKPKSLADFGVPLTKGGNKGGKSLFHNVHEVGKWAALYNGKIIGTFVDYSHAFDLCNWIDRYFKTTKIVGITGDNCRDLNWDWDFVETNLLRRKLY